MFKNISHKKYARVRPFIDCNAIFHILDNKKLITTEDIEDSFYFNSGRSGLKWFLAYLNKKGDGRLRVGVQAFTCSVVVQAIIESGKIAVFFDIDKNYFTTRHEQIDYEKIDVLIISHLFGIPNPDYEKICSVCRQKNIIVIDDLALTVDARLNNVPIGSLSDAYFYSFGFDKPISCYTGGMIKVNNQDLQKELRSTFCNLPIENSVRAKNDLLKLMIYTEFFCPETYSMGKSYHLVFEDVFLQILKHISYSKILNSKILKFYKLFWRKPRLFERFLGRIVTWNKKSNISAERLGVVKYEYIKRIWNHYPDHRNIRLLAAEKAINKIQKMFPEIQIPILSDIISPSWHRLPVRVPENQKKDFILWGQERGIELGTFNWGALSFEPYNERLKINRNNYPVSMQIIKEIVNVPIWSPDIWDF